MTKEEKMDWLRNATAEEVLERYKGTLLTLVNNHDDVDIYLECQDDILLCEAELMKRMSR